MSEGLIFLEDLNPILNTDSLYSHRGLPPVSYPRPGVLYALETNPEPASLVLFFILRTRYPDICKHYMRDAYHLLYFLDLLGDNKDKFFFDFELVVCAQCGNTIGYCVGGALTPTCYRCSELSNWRPELGNSILCGLSDIFKATGISYGVLAGAWAKAISIIKESMNDAANPGRRDAPGSGLHGTAGRRTDYEGDL